jgi:hypothetical protein
MTSRRSATASRVVLCLAAVLHRGLLADAEAKDGDGFRPRAAARFEVYPAEARRPEADAVVEQNRQYIHQDLARESPPQASGSFSAVSHFLKIDRRFQLMVIVLLGFSCW